MSILTNAVAVDGATLLSWDGRLRRFGFIIDTQRFQSSSEGARTRAAEFISSQAVAVKVSEDGPITIFTGRKELITI